jgi:Pilus formation protein N terminal region/Type II/IV secretion system protein/BON domain
MAVTTTLFSPVSVGGAQAQRAIAINSVKRTTLVTVPVGKTEDVRVDAPFTDVTVGDPEVADVTPLTDHALSILGKKIGTTRVTVYGEEKKLVGIFDIEVSYDVSRLSTELRRVTGAGIRVSSVNGRIMLSGNSPDAATLDKAVVIARQFAPDIINTVKVLQPQQVVLEVRFIEANRQAGRELGVQWNSFGKNTLTNIGSRVASDQLPVTTPGGQFQQGAFKPPNGAQVGGKNILRRRGFLDRHEFRRWRASCGEPADHLGSSPLEGVSWTVFPEPASEPAVQAPGAHPLLSDKLLDAKVRLHRRLIEEINLQALERLPEDQVRAHVQQLVTQYILVERLALNQQELNDFVSEILDEMTGLGPLEPLLKDPTIADILINGHECVYVERGGVLEPCGVRFKDEAHLLRIINKIVAAVGRRVDESHPLCDARLLDGSRVNVAVRPIGVDGPLVSIRKFSKKPFNLTKLIEVGALRPQMAELLAAAVKARVDIIQMQEIFKFVRTGTAPDGTVLGDFQATGVRPRFLGDLVNMGIKIPGSYFDPSQPL